MVSIQIVLKEPYYVFHMYRSQRLNETFLYKHWAMHNEIYFLKNPNVDIRVFRFIFFIPFL